MSVVSGAKGDIKVGTTPSSVAHMEAWKLTIKQNLEDTTSFDDNGWESSAATTKGWEGSIEGKWDVKGDTTGQKVIQDAVISGEAIDLELFTNKADTSAAYKGKAFVESIDVDTSVKGIVKLSVKFKGTGPLTPAA